MVDSDSLFLWAGGRHYLTERPVATASILVTGLVLMCTALVFIWTWRIPGLARSYLLLGSVLALLVLGLALFVFAIFIMFVKVILDIERASQAGDLSDHGPEDVEGSGRDDSGRPCLDPGHSHARTEPPDGGVMANTPNAPFASGDPGQTMHQGEELPHAQTDYDPLEVQLESMYEMALDEDEEDIGGILLVLEDVTLDYVVGVPCPISARSRSYEVTDIRNDPDALQRD